MVENETSRVRGQRDPISMRYVPCQTAGASATATLATQPSHPDAWTADTSTARYQDSLHTCQAEFLDEKDRGILNFTVAVRDGLRIEKIGGGRLGSEQEFGRRASDA